MTWLRKTRPVLIVTGLALIVASVVGAGALSGGSGASAKAEPAPAPRAAGGPIVLGTVDTDPPPVSYGLPPVLQSGTVLEKLVKDGDEVKVGQPLYSFDATLMQAQLKSAVAAVAYAKTKVKEAEEGKKRHGWSIEVMEKGVDALHSQANEAQSYLKLVKRTVEEVYKTNQVPLADWPAKLAGDPSYVDAQNKYSMAYNAWQIKVAELDALKAADPQVKVAEAEAAVHQAEVAQANAQKMVDLCVVKAKTAGTVEQVSISPGTTLGIGTRTPALWLIPTGPRVVRAEIEAEFAHRVGPAVEGKTVTIADHSDPDLTYTGTVRRIGGTFLLKRGNAENFLGGDTRVIEAVVDVADPAPHGKPPLRVGQRVRVNLGQ